MLKGGGFFKFLIIVHLRAGAPAAGLGRGFCDAEVVRVRSWFTEKLLYSLIAEW